MGSHLRGLGEKGNQRVENCEEIAKRLEVNREEAWTIRRVQTHVYKRPTEAGGEGIFIACNRGSDKCLDPGIAFGPTRTTRFEPLAQNQVWLLGTELGVTSQHFEVCPVPKETQNASIR